jgi:protein gp37
MHFARRFDGEAKGYDGTTRRGKNGTDWTGVVHQHEDRLEIPLKWRKPQRVFVDSMSDLFHPAVPFEFIARVFGVMRAAPMHTFMILTKRPERMRDFIVGCAGWEGYVTHNGEPVSSYGGSGVVVGDEDRWPLRNVWLGTSVENQEAADKRIPHLLETPAAVRFLSCEPLLGPVELFNVGGWENAAYWWGRDIKLDWIIVGGESGHGARPMSDVWARSLRDQAERAKIPFFFKQFGEYAPDGRQFETFTQWVNKASSWVQGAACFDAEGYRLKNGGEFKLAVYPVTMMRRVGKKAAGRLLDGREHNELPEAQP